MLIRLLLRELAGVRSQLLPVLSVGGLPVSLRSWTVCFKTLEFLTKVSSWIDILIEATSWAMLDKCTKDQLLKRA